MAVISVYQRDFGLLLAPQLLTELRRHFQSASTAADNHDPFQWCSQRDPLKFINQLLIKSY